MLTRSWKSLLPSLFLVSFFALKTEADDAQKSDGFGTVASIFINRCFECHNPTDKSGGFDMSTREGLLKGGENGPAIVPGKPEDSVLLDRIVDGEMPPKKQGKSHPLSAIEVDRLRQWVNQGAKWPTGLTLDPFQTTSATRAGRDFWSLQPVRRVEPPKVKATKLVANPIDEFVLSKLEEHGWTFAPEADRRVLIRRVSIDVTGLPPRFDEIEAFVRDNSPQAYEHLIDRLLASPTYGERWGRYWLDVARYADTCGYERDQTKPNAWKYRDWVIRSFNEDRPFDRFVLEQLAGDELPDRNQSTLIATGFIRLGTWNDEPNDPQEYKYERLEDMVNVTSTAFLGMTVKCARCHDHKFDPIRQTDYYRLGAAFWAGPIEPASADWLGGPDPKVVGSDAFAWTDTGRESPPLHLLKKGDVNRVGPIVPPGQLSMVAELDRPLSPPPAGAKTSHRRLQLARWIVDPRNPLTSRVWVNRIWQHHFGEGLVRSPDNFGFTGDRPTHPELLDWLASRFTEGGSKTKSLHKMILLSRTYRQASIHPDADAYNKVDAGNRLWWHAERRRLDSESLRDVLLATSNRIELDRRGGPGFVPEVSPDALEGLSKKDGAWVPSSPDEQLRRSVYLFVKRGLLAPMMTTFDAPDTTLPCGRRDVTLVAPQALALMNNRFVHEQSEALCKRIIAQAENTDASARIQMAWRLILARDPSAQELTAAREHLSRQESHFELVSHDRDSEILALNSLCQVLLNTNEFLFVD